MMILDMIWDGSWNGMEARLENFHNDYGNEHFGLAFTVNTIHSNECHMLYHFIRTCLRREEFLRKRGREGT